MSIAVLGNNCHGKGTVRVVKVDFIIFTILAIFFVWLGFEGWR